MNQMVRAVLLPPVGPAPEAAPAVVHDLDASQQAAVDVGGRAATGGSGPGHRQDANPRPPHPAQA